MRNDSHISVRFWRMGMLFAGVFLSFFMLDYFAFSLGDDLGYLFTDGKLHDGSGLPVGSFADIVATQRMHYLSTNGRFIVHLTVQSMLCLVPRWIFTILNSLAFTLMCILATKMVEWRWQWALIMPALLWLCLPVPGITMLSLVAFAVNYLWVAVAVLLWLRMFLKPHHDKISALFGEGGALVWMFMASFIVGSLHEGYSLPVCAGVALAMILRGVGLSQARMAMACGFILGTLIEFCAPGNFARMETGSLSFQTILMKSSLVIRDAANTGIGILAAVMLVTAIFDWKEFLRILGHNIVLLTAIASSLALAMLTYTSVRQLFPAALFSAIVVGRILWHYLHTRRKMLAVTSGIAVGFTLFVTIAGSVFRYRSYETYLHVLHQYEKAAATGEDAVFADASLANFHNEGIIYSLCRRYDTDIFSGHWVNLMFDGYTKRGLSRLYCHNSRNAIKHLLPYPKEQLIEECDLLKREKDIGRSRRLKDIDGRFAITVVPAEQGGTPHESADAIAHIPWEEFTADGWRYIIVPSGPDSLFFK